MFWQVGVTLRSIPLNYQAVGGAAVASFLEYGFRKEFIRNFAQNSKIGEFFYQWADYPQVIAAGFVASSVFGSIVPLVGFVSLPLVFKELRALAPKNSVAYEVGFYGDNLLKTTAKVTNLAGSILFLVVAPSFYSILSLQVSYYTFSKSLPSFNPRTESYRWAHTTSKTY